MPNARHISLLKLAQPYFWGLLGVFLGTLLLSPIHGVIDLSNTALLYVLAVVVVGIRAGRGPAVATALFSSLCFAHVFVPPYFSLAITDTQYLLSAMLMLIVALLVGHLTSRLKQHADFSARKSQESASLYGLARRLAGEPGPQGVAQAAVEFVGTALAARAVRIHTPADLAAAEPLSLQALCAAEGRRLLRTLEGGWQRVLLPLPAAGGLQGVLDCEIDEAFLAAPDGSEYLETIASVLAVALERSHFAELARESEVRQAAESLRASILSALSHDLRTPLTALVGMAETLALGKASPERQKQMLESLCERARSISGQMSNLLDMARLSAGRLQLNLAWQPVEEVLGATLRLVRGQWKDREITVDVPAGLPPINIDAVLIERVLWNLIENAIKYGTPDAPVEIAVRRQDDCLEVSVSDSGPGLPGGDATRLFELFQRGRSESDIPGLGLGLSIARSIVEAHGGRLAAQNRLGGGAVFRVLLPLGEPPDFTIPGAVA